MKKIIIVIFFLFYIYILSINKSNNDIRFRIISSTNSEKDKYIKEEVSNRVLYYLSSINNYNSINNARDAIKENINNIDYIVEETLRENNYDESYSINYGDNYIPEKEYNGKTYESGYYESLVITLGEGKGENYFCIIFPNICLIDDGKETKIFIKELFESIKSKKK